MFSTQEVSCRGRWFVLRIGTFLLRLFGRKGQHHQIDLIVERFVEIFCGRREWSQIS